MAIGRVHTPAFLLVALLGFVEAALVTGGAEIWHRQRFYAGSLQLALSGRRRGWKGRGVKSPFLSYRKLKSNVR